MRRAVVDSAQLVRHAPVCAAISVNVFLRTIRTVAEFPFPPRVGLCLLSEGFRGEWRVLGNRGVPFQLVRTSQKLSVKRY